MARIFVLIVLSIFIASMGQCQGQPEKDEAKQFTPKKVQVDTNYDGKPDRVEYYDNNGQVMRVEQDTTGSGKINEWVIYKNGTPIRKEKDSNGDGKPDVWIEY